MCLLCRVHLRQPRTNFSFHPVLRSFFKFLSISLHRCVYPEFLRSIGKIILQREQERRAKLNTYVDFFFNINNILPSVRRVQKMQNMWRFVGCFVSQKKFFFMTSLLSSGKCKLFSCSQFCIAINFNE